MSPKGILDLYRNYPSPVSPPVYFAGNQNMGVAQEALPLVSNPTIFDPHLMEQGGRFGMEAGHGQNEKPIADRCCMDRGMFHTQTF